jgi:hypothetical protein
MPQKLAIAISGAVSLGSYQAGVMYEIIKAIAQHNVNTTKQEDKIEIDVITGASAGAMTACMLAQRLLFDGKSLGDPDKNPLYEAWVKKVDIKGLLDLQPNDNPEESILSSELIAKIGKELILNRYEMGNQQIKDKHPAIGEMITIGISMANLDGIQFSTNLRNISIDGELSDESRFSYAQHKDFSIHHLNYDLSDTKDIWEVIEEHARSSGAFPFAFRPIKIGRKRTEPVFRGSDFQNNTDTELNFTYTDGGVFENEPIGLAKQLVNEIDDNPTDYEKRFFLYVAPGGRQLTSSQSDINLLNTGKSLVSAIQEQARFRDWINTSEINEQIEKFDERSDELKNLFLGETFDFRPYQTVSEEILRILYPSQNGDSADNDIQRLMSQFHDEYEELVKNRNEATANAWINTILVLEKSADLGSRDLLRIYSITAREKELDGTFLRSFGGFFEEQYRQNDYNTGRRNAIEFSRFLKERNECRNQGEMFLYNFDINESEGIGGEVNTIPWEEIDRKIKIQVKKRLIDSFKLLIGSQNIIINSFISLFLSPKLNDSLKLNNKKWWRR